MASGVSPPPVGVPPGSAEFAISYCPANMMIGVMASVGSNGRHGGIHSAPSAGFVGPVIVAYTQTGLDREESPTVPLVSQWCGYPMPFMLDRKSTRLNSS